MANLKFQTDIKKPLWLKYSDSEVRSLIHKLADKSLSAEKIGLALRDQYGIPRVKVYGFKIKDVLKDTFQEPTIYNLQRKLKKIEEHTQKNKQDKKAGRALIVTKAKLKKRQDYHAI